ncbi:hypothetical protein [Streptomyces sp. NPDC020141]|uniref:hypothetical protein n=1 Tax=Streptomyces sp. NPDC020141 TaxID=3365065 RepID=UPI0037978B8D
MTLSRRDRQYGSAVGRVWSGVLSRVGRAWTDLGSWRDADVSRFQQTVLPVVIAGQRQVASLTASYLETLYREIDAEHRTDLNLDAVTGAALRGVDPEVIYRRPFTEMRRALSTDVPLDVAVDRGAHRLKTITTTDLQLARTHTAREVASRQPGVTYTIRELYGEYDCALCMIASTQRYHKEDLLPIHPGCDCIVKTVTSDYDPGQVVDEARLTRIHELVEEATGRSDRGGRAVDYRQIIIAREHGEIGPVLGFRDQGFTGPGDLRSAAGGGQQPPIPLDREPVGPDEELERLGDSIFDSADPATRPGARERAALDHAVEAVASVHSMDRNLPRIPLETEVRAGFLGTYVTDTAGNSRRFRINPAGPWPELTAVHELGHFLDHKGLGADGRTFATEHLEPGGLLHEWWTTVQETASYHVLTMMSTWSERMRWAKIRDPDGTTRDFKIDRGHVTYLMGADETFARSYAQWVAWRSGDDILMEQVVQASDPGLGSILISGFTPGYPRQWAEGDFEPVAEAFDRLFERLGLY